MVFAGAAAAPSSLLLSTALRIPVGRVAQLPVVVKLALKDIKGGSLGLLRFVMWRHSEELLAVVRKLLRQLDRLQIFDLTWQQKRATLTAVILKLAVVVPPSWRSCFRPRTALPLFLMGSSSGTADAQALPLLHLLFLSDNEAMLANCLLLMISVLSVIIFVIQIILKQLALSWRRTGQESFSVKLAQIRRIKLLRGRLSRFDQIFQVG